MTLDKSVTLLDSLCSILQGVRDEGFDLEIEEATVLAETLNIESEFVNKLSQSLQNGFDHDKCFDNCEEAGDAAIAGQSLKKAIEYYRLMLLCARITESTSTVSTALVSLALDNAYKSD
ncbi:hypothetical protein HCN44_003423 [Aphidius gifuensis]|uniref:Uncharacterized protein n=1 Tax=Aphidius gifuensis TaxID=684658 RepID=A0A835CNY5_APHGI|nr:hypothetical protein HCN44_003423 [Aphidius gifuensis]